MVEPPKLQVQFDARQKVIPILFEKHCKQGYTLKEIPPEKEKNPKPGPIKSPTRDLVSPLKKILITN